MKKFEFKKSIREFSFIKFIDVKWLKSPTEMD